MIISITAGTELADEVDLAGEAPAVPDAVAARLDAASKYEALLRKIAEIAKQTNSAAAAAIDANVASILKAKGDARTSEMASWGPFDGWSGSGEVRAFASSVNTNNGGIALAGRLTRQGRRWTHAVRSASHYQRENGFTSKKRLFAGYEGNFKVSARAYALLTAATNAIDFQG